MTQEEKALSLQIQAYLTTASDELYAPGKPLYTEEHHKGIHECMKMWQKLHQYYFSTKQEQPKVDLVAKLKQHLATTPKEQLEKEWKELEHWNNVGPTVQEFLYGKQPEVDLEKEVEKFCLEYDSRKEVWFNMTPRDKKMLSTPTWSNFAANLAHHFYELGLKARKEE